MNTFLVETIRLRGEIMEIHRVAKTEEAALAGHKTVLPDADLTNVKGFKFEFGEVTCTVYFRYRYFEFEKESYYGHTDIVASDLGVAIDTVMAQEKESMRGHTGDRGTVEFVYATNNIDPDKGMWVFRHGVDGGTFYSIKNKLEDGGAGKEEK